MAQRSQEARHIAEADVHTDFVRPLTLGEGGDIEVLSIGSLDRVSHLDMTHERFAYCCGITTAIFTSGYHGSDRATARFLFWRGRRQGHRRRAQGPPRGGGVEEVHEKAAAFALAGTQNPFAASERSLLPWTKIEDKGMNKLLDHCLYFYNLPSQVSRRA